MLDAGDAADLLDLVRQEQGHGETGRRFPRKHTLADIYSRTVNAQQPVRAIVAESFPWCEEHVDVLGPLFQAFTARKRALGAIDLDDLLVLWRALMADEHAGAHIASAFDHVLVDEYQDVNGLQVAIVEGFARRDCHVTAVGDDFQAIYAFRSASARAHPRVPRSLHGRDDGDARAQLPRDAAAARRRERRRATGRRRASRRRCARSATGGARPALVFCRDQLHEAADGVRPRAGGTARRECCCASRRCSRAQAMTPTRSSSSCPGGGSRS